MPPVGEVDDDLNYELEDDDLDNEFGDDDNDNTEDELGSLDPALQRQIQKLLDEREAALSKEIESGKTKHPVYKGIQRTLAKEQERSKRLEQTLEAALAKLSQFDLSVDELYDAVNWAGNNLLEALPDDTKNLALNDLNRRNVERQKREIERLRNGGGARIQSGQRNGGEDEPQWLKDGRAEFKALCDEEAAEAGIEADDERLDYGDDNEAVVKRLKKFRASLKAIVNEDGLEKRVASVRKKTEPVTTRTSGGGAVGTGVQRKSLEDASRDIMREIRRGGAGLRR